MCISVCVCSFVFFLLIMCVCVCVGKCVCVFVCMHVCVCVCLHIYICIYIDVYIDFLYVYICRDREMPASKKEIRVLIVCASSLSHPCIGARSRGAQRTRRIRRQRLSVVRMYISLFIYLYV